MKHKLITITFILFLNIFFLLSIFLEKQSFSFVERRTLTSFPNIQITKILDGSFFKEFEKFTNDQFPLRKSFRNLKGWVSLHIFQKKENENTYIISDGIYQIEKNINEKSFQHITNLIHTIMKNHILSSQIYTAIVPDKNYYLKKNTIPTLNYNLLKEKWIDKFPTARYIDLFEELNLESYYKTDIHWKQEALENVLKKLQNSMNLSPTSFPKEEMNYYEFYGSLKGRIANDIKPDNLKYLTNDTIKQATVYNYEKNKIEEVYNYSNLTNPDAYDIFLSGASAVLTINNTTNNKEKELIIFRDSFASSLSPLLIENYKKITLIDLRYFSSSLLNNNSVIEFKKENQDILFLYSIPIINDSFTLK